MLKVLLFMELNSYHQKHFQESLLVVLFRGIIVEYPSDFFLLKKFNKSFGITKKILLQLIFVFIVVSSKENDIFLKH